MIKESPKYRETRLADHGRQAIASAFGDALLDLTGQVYAVEVVNMMGHPVDEAEIYLWARRVDDSEIPDSEKR